MSIKKRVNKREYEFTKLFANIAPSISDVKPIGAAFDITLVKYPMTLSGYVDNGGDLKRFQPHIEKLINTIHHNKVLHGDLHSDNIVVNPETNEVKIIDYGRSRYFSEVTPSVIQQFNEFLEPEEPFQTLNDIITFERTMYLRDF